MNKEWETLDPLTLYNCFGTTSKALMFSSGGEEMNH